MRTLTNQIAKYAAAVNFHTLRHSPIAQKRASIVSAATLHSASPSCGTPACDYDQITPAISQFSLKVASTTTSGWNMTSMLHAHNSKR